MKVRAICKIASATRDQFLEIFEPTQRVLSNIFPSDFFEKKKQSLKSCKNIQQVCATVVTQMSSTKGVFINSSKCDDEIFSNCGQSRIIHLFFTSIRRKGVNRTTKKIASLLSPMRSKELVTRVKVKSLPSQRTTN